MSDHAFGSAPLRFGPVADFSYDLDADESAFVKAICATPSTSRLSKFYLTREGMASSGWYPPALTSSSSGSCGAPAVLDPYLRVTSSEVTPLVALTSID